MRRGVSYFLAASAVALLLVGLLRADDKRLPLRVWLFRLPGTELGLDVADMDGDGLTDLVMSHMRGLVVDGLDRQVSIYVQSSDRAQRFAAKPAWVHTVPRDACAFVAGDFDPAPGGEVVFLCPSRLVISRRGDAPLLIPLEGFFDYPENAALPVWTQAWDLDGDGLPELLVPTRDGYAVFGRTKSTTLAERSRLKVPVRLKFGPPFETALLNRFLSASSRLRRAVAVDMNGDGKKDLVVYRKKGLARYLQREDGTFPERPDREEAIQVVKRAGDAKEDSSEAFANVRLTLDDLNGDGLPDLLATRTVGEVGVFETLRTQQLIFLGRKDGTWDEANPDVVLNFKGISDDPVLVDWDGDGRRDLIMSSYRMDMFTNVKRALTDSMTVTYMIFRQPKQGSIFLDEPSYVLDAEVPLKVLEKKGGVRAVLFTADLDGDGLRDMISRRADGGLSVAVGRLDDGELGFDERSTVRLAVGSTNPPWVVDLDGDGKDELMLEPYGGDDLSARTVRVVGVAQ